MATTVVKRIGSGGDYSTLQAWEDASPANLVTSDQIWRGEMIAGTSLSGNALLTVAGSTTDATRYKILTCEAGASFRDNASKQTNALRWNASNGAAINTGDAFNDGMTVNEAFFRMVGIQLKGGGGSNHFALLVTAADVTVDSCIIQSDLPLAATNSRFLMKNTVVIKSASGGAACGLQSSFTLVNCTIVKPSDVGAVTLGLDIQFTNGACVVKNCAVFGFTTASATDGNGNTTHTTCQTDQASPLTGYTTQTYSTSLFPNITLATCDYRAKSGSALLNAGTTDATNAATDIFGVARPSGASYDVGAHEFVAASVPTVTDFGDESHKVGEVGVVITGTAFGATQGTGSVKISPTDNVADANAVSQTVTAWGDTSITINIVRGGGAPLSLFTNVYLFVTNDTASSNAAGYVHQLTAPVAALFIGTTLID